MSRLQLIVMGSLLANAALAMVVFRGGKGPEGAGSVAASDSISRNDSSTTTAPPLEWEQLHALPHAEFTAQLRRHGFPPHILRALVEARVSEQFRPRWKALLQGDDNYWRGTGSAGQRLDPRVAAERRALWQEQSDIVRQLLGPEPETAVMRAQNRFRYGNLDADRIRQVKAIESDYGELIAQIRHDSQGLMLQEDRDQMAFLQAEKLADLAAVLTPEEFRAYDLRSSQTALRLRSQLAAFEPSEEEYLALFEAHRAFDEKYGAVESGALSNEQRRRRQDAQPELDQEIAAILGPERHAEYELRTHSNWLASQRWVSQQQLPSATTTQLVALEREIEHRSRALRESRDLSSVDRNAQRDALAQEAETRLGKIISQEQMGTYQAGPGRWLRNLRPPQR